jgi:hypothetical protein
VVLHGWRVRVAKALLQAHRQRFLFLQPRQLREYDAVGCAIVEALWAQ